MMPDTYCHPGLATASQRSKGCATWLLLMVRGRRVLRVRPLTANFSLLAAATRRLTVEEPAPSRGGTPAWPRFSCRSQIVAAIIAPPPFALSWGQKERHLTWDKMPFIVPYIIYTMTMQIYKEF